MAEPAKVKNLFLESDLNLEKFHMTGEERNPTAV